MLGSNTLPRPFDGLFDVSHFATASAPPTGGRPGDDGRQRSVPALGNLIPSRHALSTTHGRPTPPSAPFRVAMIRAWRPVVLRSGGVGRGSSRSSPRRPLVVVRQEASSARSPPPRRPGCPPSPSGAVTPPPGRAVRGGERLSSAAAVVATACPGSGSRPRRAGRRRCCRRPREHDEQERAARIVA